MKARSSASWVWSVGSMVVLAAASSACGGGGSTSMHEQGVDYQPGVPGTTLCAGTEASAVCEHTLDYDWTITDTAAPASVTVGSSGSTVTYTLTATRRVGSDALEYTAQGQICVTNHGEIPTEGLRIVAALQSRVSGGTFADLAGASQTTMPTTQLAGGEERCFPFGIVFTPPGNAADFQVTADVTITNFQGHMGTAYGLSGDDYTSTAFTLPTSCSDRVIDAQADVTHSVSCGTGYTCMPGAPGPFHFNDSGSVDVPVGVQGPCGLSASMQDTAVLTESGPNPPGGETHISGSTASLASVACDNGGGSVPMVCATGDLPCGATCCKVGEMCSSGVCVPPPATSCGADQTACGSACCDAGMVCSGGACTMPMSMCSDGQPMCGSVCCGAGMTCENGVCTTPTVSSGCGDRVTCGSMCCDAGMICSSSGSCTTPPSSNGTQGCTPGYWKNHTRSWDVYSPTQTIGSVFNVPASYGLAGDTLQQGLALRGGSTNEGAAEILLRAGIAALLNTTNGGVMYPRTTAGVIADVNAALASNSRDVMIALASSLDRDNNLGCPLN